MPNANKYQIGTTLEGIATLKSLGLPDPKHSFMGYSATVDLGNGGVRGIGLPVARWIYGYLTQAQRDIFRTFCTGASATVFIETRTSDSSDAFDQFQGVMIWPREPEDKDAFRRINFVLEFRNLVAV